jgi:DNA polymerase III sliding clamp (beta) subunit (PCNA family)
MSRSRAVRLEFAPGRLTIAASTSEAGEAGEHLDIESEIEMTCAFNATYLLDGLALCGGDVRLGLRTAGEQALLTPTRERQWRWRVTDHQHLHRHADASMISLRASRRYPSLCEDARPLVERAAEPDPPPQ